MGQSVRLDKFLADAGMGTRSEVKKLIRKGLAEVDGAVVKDPDQKVIPGESAVTLQGEPVGALPEFEYYLLHKPAGYVSATEDSREKTVMELVPSGRKGLFPAGRLDKDTEGLLLITNDGALAHRLLSPKRHVEKTYDVLVSGELTEEDVKAMERGVDIGDERPTLPARLEILDAPGASQSRGLLTVSEGRFHQVKRMMEAVGKKVLYLKRISMGPLTLPGDLPRGACRALTEEEVYSLKHLEN